MHDKLESHCRGDLLDVSNQLYDASLEAFRKQIFAFAKELREKMLDAGLPGDVTARVLKETFGDLRDMPEFRRQVNETQTAILEAFVIPKNQGQDAMGRILTTWLFKYKKSPARLYPAGSEKDAKAREEFVPGVLPRPLLAYFLASIRGSLDGPDCFDSRPMLYSEDSPDLEKWRTSIKELLEKHVVIQGKDTRVMDWGAAYKNKKIRRLAAEIAMDGLKQIKPLGADRFARILDNIRRKAEGPLCAHLGQEMERTIVSEDVQQIQKALLRLARIAKG